MSLVLTRRPGEKILIGDDIVVTFQGFNNNSAVIAISAPKNVAIVREEIKDKKFEQKVSTSSDKKKMAPFLKAHKTPKTSKEEKRNTVAQAVAGAVDVIKGEVNAL